MTKFSIMKNNSFKSNSLFCMIRKLWIPRIPILNGGTDFMKIFAALEDCYYYFINLGI